MMSTALPIVPEVYMLPKLGTTENHMKANILRYIQ